MGIWRELSGVIFPTSWNFFGNHDDNNRSGDTARYAGGGTKSVIIIIDEKKGKGRLRRKKGHRGHGAPQGAGRRDLNLKMRRVFKTMLATISIYKDANTAAANESTAGA